ncbi:MAG: hypothetical protein ONB17_07830 [candidate division KSB1 bacterium]|nr:hypothetical protein [candidate division KSB1 bacterium]MDZ7293918.1 hypothetical protein [candidate division KSB1 bacterium]MDZ7377983.1 hypothetical protein [candidate division KSB1 bacterium]MDZ7393034.1 hypothetical protein [candidate division KSB1 bacterium]
MPEVRPRFEFRAFAQSFGLVEEKMRTLSRVEQIRESLEIYIVSAQNNDNNTKIRDQLMDIKVLVQKKQGLEQWNPRMKGQFPMSAEMIRDQVFPAFGVPSPAFARPSYTLSQFLEELILPHPSLVAVHVFKRRFGFTINGCIAELAEVYINGAKILTASIESEDVGAILQAKEMVGLTPYENVNYLLAIKRVIGLEPLPATSVYRAAL